MNKISLVKCVDFNVSLHNLACTFSLAGEMDSSFKYLYLTMKIRPDFTTLTDPCLLQLRDT
jgi:hypothetical protein